MSITVALYSHDSVGLGHARRNRAIAYALDADLPRLTGHRVRGILIAGHPAATADSLPDGWDWMVLPGFTSTVDGYTSRHLDISSERLWHLRSTTAGAALEAMSPDLLIVDRHPFGVDHELLPILERLRAIGTRCVLGMREVLDTPEAAAEEFRKIGGAPAVARYYDSVWVYGDPKIYNPLDTGEIPKELADRVRFTGYLSHGRPDDPIQSEQKPRHRPYVLTIVGGGSDGGHIVQTAVQAEVPTGHDHLIIAGPQMPEDIYSALTVQAAANPTHGIELLRSASDVPALIRDAAAVISMGGYNSAAEIMATDTPALIIPRLTRRQEQPRRANALAEAGVVDTLSQQSTNAAELSNWLAWAVTHRVGRESINLNGLMHISPLAAEQVQTAALRSARLEMTQPLPEITPQHAQERPVPHVH